MCGIAARGGAVGVGEGMDDSGIVDIGSAAVCRREVRLKQGEVNLNVGVVADLAMLEGVGAADAS